MSEKQNNSNSKTNIIGNIRRDGKNIIAIASGKNNVGKTWLSITLAHAFAKKGRRVLLFDGDLGLKNIDTQLGLETKNKISLVISNEKTLNQIISHYDTGNFDIITCSSGSGSLSNIPLGRLQTLKDDLKILSNNYDKTIIDLSSGIDKPIKEFAKTAGEILVICDDETTSLTETYSFIKTISVEENDVKIKIIINTANTKREGERTFNTLKKACQSFLKIDPELIGIIRKDAKIKDAIEEKKSILTTSPDTQAAKDIEKIANSLL